MEELSRGGVDLEEADVGATGDGEEDATRAFLSLAGSWEDTRSARQIAQDIRKRRGATRRFRGSGNVFA